MPLDRKIVCGIMNCSDVATKLYRSIHIIVIDADTDTDKANVDA